MDFARQPAHAAVVGFQLLADEVPDVDIAFVGFHCLGFVWASAPFTFSNEKAWKLITKCRRRLWNAFCTISNKIHANSMNLCLLIPVREIFQIYDEGTRAKAQFVCLCDYNPIFFRFSILKFGSKIKILSDLDMVLADNDEKWAKSAQKQIDFAPKRTKC